MAKATKKKKKSHAPTMAGFQGPSPVSVHRDKKIPKSKHVLKHVRIEPAANGFTVHTQHGGPNGEYIDSGDEKPMVFGSHADTAAHVAGLLKGAVKSSSKAAKDRHKASDGAMGTSYPPAKD